MAQGPSGSSDLAFLQAFYKRGFVNLPRMLFDYSADLELDYDALGRIFTLLACVGGPMESAFEAYRLTRKANPRDFDQLRSIVLDLQQRQIVRCEEDTPHEVRFTFNPLFFRLQAVWEDYRAHHEAEQTAGVDPAILAAEKQLGIPLSERAMNDIRDWIDTFGFDADLVVAVIKEGQAQGVTHMNYLNQIARRWYEEGIRTPEEAEAFAQQNKRWLARHKVIIQYLGLKRALTKGEQDLMEKWTGEWGFSNEVIIRACAESTGAQNPLQYVNGILESWREKGVRTVADVDALHEAHRKRSGVKDSGSAAKPAGRRSSSARSGVFLQRDKKDDDYYDHIYKKFGK